MITNIRQTSIQSHFPYSSPELRRIFSLEHYRFGFNGKENDNEVKGTGNQQDYGMRIYDPRIARFLSVDPLTSKFPFYTPYQFAGNKPISCIDLDGLEDIYFMNSISDQNAKAIMDLITSTEIGAQIIDEFKNTNPESGPVNAGYDVYIRTASSDEVLKGGMWGRTGPMITPDETISKFGEGPQEYPVLEAIIEARKNKESQAYKNFVRYYGEEFVNDPNLETSLANKRGVIIIVIPEGAKFASENENALLGASEVLGHEFACHANESSQTGKTQNATRQKQMHIDKTGTSDGSKNTEGSLLGRFKKQMTDALKNKK